MLEEKPERLHIKHVEDHDAAARTSRTDDHLWSFCVFTFIQLEKDSV